MAASDSTISFADTDCRVYIEDGASGSVEVTPRLGSITWSVTKKPSTEVMHRGKHQSTPVIRTVGSANVTGAFSMSAGSFKGSTAATPYEALMGLGVASGWTNTASGDGITRKIRVVITNPSTGGATQTTTFAYVQSDEVSFDMGGNDGTAMLEFTFTDYEDQPTIT